VRALSLSPDVVLAVYAHPDDADVAAGGSLALWAARGADVHLVVACDGDKGTHQTNGGGPTLAETRLQELRAAAALLGVKSTANLGIPDGEVENSLSLREVLVRYLRTLRPSVVVAPDPTAVFFGDVYVNHRDHREIGWALLDAVAPAAAMPLYFPETGEAHRVGRLLLSGTQEPDVVVDISSSIDAKVAAVLAHRSQMGGDDAAIGDVVYARAEQAGRPVNVAYGEAFRNLELSY